MLHTVDGESVKGLEISAVVRKIIGLPNSRLTLEVYRPRETAHIPPTPVMVPPFQRKEIVLRRKLRDVTRDSKVAGLGILFHKVMFNVFVCSYNHRIGRFKVSVKNQHIEKGRVTATDLNALETIRRTTRENRCHQRKARAIRSLFRPFPQREARGVMVSESSRLWHVTYTTLIVIGVDFPEGWPVFCPW
jgi:hypothetical protein